MKGQTSHISYILLGGNLGDTRLYLAKARLLIQDRVGVLRSTSSVYRSEPWGMQSTQWFLNQVVEVETKLEPAEVMESLILIEEELGRTRKLGTDVGYQSRTIDLDILYYDDKVIQEAQLEIPHPRLHLRRFTLLPLVEIAEHLKHPIFQHTQLELLASCQDQGETTIDE